jgi:hypothetical protein
MTVMKEKKKESCETKSLITQNVLGICASVITIIYNHQQITNVQNKPNEKVEKKNVLVHV